MRELIFQLYRLAGKMLPIGGGLEVAPRISMLFGVAERWGFSKGGISLEAWSLDSVELATTTGKTFIECVWRVSIDNVCPVLAEDFCLPSPVLC